MAKELNKVEVEFSIGGQSYYLVELTLNQRFNAHHTFDAIVDYEELDSQWMESPGKVIQLISQNANIEMKHTDGKGINLFSGIVTNVSFVGRHGQQNYIRISGCSPTIRLDGAKTMDSFMDKNLSSIVSETVGTSGNGGSVTASPVFSGQIDYICQYEETAFEFLNRLSWMYGEWFFYDGTTCYFGKPGGGESDTITYDTEMTEFTLTANMRPTVKKLCHYLVHDDKEIDKDAPQNVPGVSGYHKVAADMSSAVYTSDAILVSEAPVSNLKELEELAKAEKTRMVAEMLIMKGSTQTSKVKIGKTLTIKLPKTMGTTKKEIGNFFVTEVTHTYTQKGKYSNTFTAIPADMENIPMEPVNSQKAYPQMATVKTNDDMKKLGRVKVEFQWQKAKNKTTNWIRVQTPDAGKSDKVAQNRGFVFIPEDGDAVMIDFEYGDPSRPYVTGSIFSEKVSSGGGDTNKSKSLTTRSGSTVTLNDEDGSILISDQTGEDCIIVDGKDKISVITTKTIELNNSQSSIVMDEDNIVIYSNNIVINGEKVVAMVSGDETVVTSNDGEKMVAIGGTAVSMAAKNETSVSGGTEVGVNSPKVEVSGTANVDISGGIVKINS